MESANNKSCPSSVATPGAVLLGSVNADGTVGFIETPITIDEAFMEMGKDLELERSFRFSGKCVQSGCRQWKDGNCTVIKRIITAEPDWHLQHPQLPACSIRATCRWYAQEGAKACSYCAYITTNSMA
jgi:hypothetical protein